MDYRECRMSTFLHIFSCSGLDVNKQKAFLALGGIKNGFYIVYEKGIPFFIPNGYSKIHYPSILDEYKIEYKVIDIEDFIDMYKKNHLIKAENLFIVAVNGNINKKTDIEKINWALVGESIKVILDIDIEKNTLIVSSGFYDKECIDIDFLRELKNAKNLMSNIRFDVYSINKSKIKSCNAVKEKLNRDNVSLLKECADNFLVNKKYIYKDQNIIRIDGPMVYKYAKNQFINLKNEYVKCKDSKRKRNMITYINYLIIEFKNYVEVSSDANFRNEFVDVIKYVAEENDVSSLRSNIEKWHNIAYEWIKLTLNLTKLIKKVDGDELITIKLDTIINFYNKIERLEMEAMIELKDTLNCSM